ncbi:uncharacterized protein [Nicotiana sylvestris]|uniref:uncharacterized protein n=1 Tax=Nicotiana sylvestris TaxID=4096 RepID=UPI00388C8616
MANPSENPSSPPKEIVPTPSITPSTTPISKKGRVKMMARKVVAGGEQIKKINEKLKASREEEPQKSDESFKSATEREETFSFETEKVTYVPKVTPEIISEVSTNLENRFVLVGTVARVETTKSGKIGGAIVVWSEESAGEEDSVREIEGSGSGEAAERKKSLGVKVPGTARENKKRKSDSSITVETPLTRERATRTQKKQSEAELETALEESKKKVASKEKKKVVDPVKVVEIDEINLVLRDEEETEEMEVVTLKAKKDKTYIKKPVSKTRSYLLWLKKVCIETKKSENSGGRRMEWKRRRRIRC